ncbi:iron-containing alcohol dehydrogenase [Haliea sp.]|jgi:alcohol dehydrogenase class IV|uniref:iron-containing alcohol dehydrogenase n=1 Tax=Haliea sp. TaxID=1932666 RepID=UPI000C5AD2C1|nr:iron-containing alcohol dehydrogenase [Haliea sp.]MAD65843.1 alcohol dehydrogenase [Haliea sp.]|tara:strand:- start:3228 stop:4424 length:1197 start_codon:yes stop_codon:yes gene_type:complete
MSSTGAFQYWQRTMVHAGPGTLIRLPGLFSGLGSKKVLLVSDKGLKDVGIVDKVAALFDEQRGPGGVRLAGVFTDTAPDAESGCIDDCLAVARATGADGLLAVGGGSVLDSVKLVKLAMYSGVDSVAQLLKSPVKMMNWPEVQYMGVPHISVPTTAGTGAEVTNGAVIYNKQLGIKHLIVSNYLESDIAVLDAHMTTGLPPMLTAATGMDALTHAIETMGHPNTSHFALAHAETSAKIIVENLPKVVADGSDVLARQAMLSASAMACNSVVNDLGASPVHNFAHAFGAVCHIHHGEANGVLLPVVMEEFADFYVPVVERLKGVFGVEGEGRDAVLACAAAIRDLLVQMGHPLDFARHDIPASKMPEILAAIAGDPIAAFLPLPMDIIESVCRRVCNWS